ncbi:MAG TPA: hypothetical protein VF175_18010 [Lacipirellula sp.]|jgi:hypothetical protein
MAQEANPGKKPAARSSHEVPRAEFFTAVAVVSGISLAYTVGSDWIPRLVKGPPLLVHIDSSECVDPGNSMHAVAFTIENVSSSGVYLDMLELKRPAGSIFRYTVRRETDMNMGNLGRIVDAIEAMGQMRTAFRPGELIARGMWLKLVVHLRCPDTDEFWREPYGTLAMTIAPLNEKKPPKPAEIHFRLRRPV